MNWYRQTQQQALHPLLLAATFHYQFVAIHPFDDGNGRMARLLMNLILMQAGYVPVVIRIDNKPEYLLALEKADAGDLEEFITLVGEALLRSLDAFLQAAKGEGIDTLDNLAQKVERLQAGLNRPEGK